MLTKPQEQWLVALESGKYQQGHVYLHTIIEGKSDHFCCLGVACHIFKEELGLVISKEREGHVIVWYDNDFTFLPPKVISHLGLRDSRGSPLEDKSLQPLAYYNDCIDDRLSFKEIAAIIRDNPSNYFYYKD